MPGAFFKNDPAEGTRKKYAARVEQINSLEPAMAALSDEALRAKTPELKQRVSGGQSLESILPEAFAVSPQHGATGPVGLAAGCCLLWFLGWVLPTGVPGLGPAYWGSGSGSWAGMWILGLEGWLVGQQNGSWAARPGRSSRAGFDTGRV